MQKTILALNAATMINLIQKIIQNLNNKIKSHSPSNLAIKKMYLFKKKQLNASFFNSLIKQI